MSNDTKWLDELKAGDEVAMRTGYVYAGYKILKVERMTRTQIILTGGLRFYRNSCYRVGGDACSIVEPTQEIRDTIRKEELIGQFESTKWHRWPLSTLERIAAILNEQR